jgi:hypothetical protein
MFGKSKVYFFEDIAKRAVRYGTAGKLALKAARFALGKSGPTVTDYHEVDSARAHKKRAIANGLISAS